VEAYPDPTTTEGDWSCVDLEPVQTLAQPLPLALIKTDPLLKTLPLVRQSRLSVSPLDRNQFDRVLELGATSLGSGLKS
jgi:predicted RNA-binding protein with PUA-like domain